MAEEPEQDQRAVLIHVKLTIAGLVSLGSDTVQSLDQAAQRLEVFQAVNVFGANLAASGSHAAHHASLARSAQLHLLNYRDCLARILCRTAAGRERITRANDRLVMARVIPLASARGFGG